MQSATLEVKENFTRFLKVGHVEVLGGVEAAEAALPELSQLAEVVDSRKLQKVEPRQVKGLAKVAQSIAFREARRRGWSEQLQARVREAVLINLTVIAALDRTGYLLLGAHYGMWQGDNWFLDDGLVEKTDSLVPLGYRSTPQGRVCVAAWL